MPTITITLTEQEQEAFRQLIHAALLHTGEGALDVAAHFKNKIVAARQDAIGGAQRTGEGLALADTAK